MVNTYSAGGVVINNKGQVVVSNVDGDSWSLPKGHIDKNEDALTAAKREIYEESGVNDLEYVRDLGTYQRFKLKHGIEDKNTRKNITMFLFKTSQEELKPTDPDNPMALWVDKEKVADLLTHPKDKEFFIGILKLLY